MTLASSIHWDNINITPDHTNHAGSHIYWFTVIGFLLLAGKNMGEWSVCESKETLEGKDMGGGVAYRKRRDQKKREKEIRRRDQPADGFSAGEIKRRKIYRLGKSGQRIRAQ